MSLLFPLLFLMGQTFDPVFNNPTPDNTTCPDFWHSYDGSCYSHYGVEMSWADADLHCASQGATLTSVHSLDEDDFIQTLIAASQSEWRAWIGMHDMDTEGEWMWSDDTNVTFTHWREGEPNNSGGKEDCAATSILNWNDYPCQARLPFVCKSLVD